MNERYFGSEKTRSILAMGFGAVLARYNRNIDDPKYMSSESMDFDKWVMTELGEELLKMRKTMGFNTMLGPREQLSKALI